MKFPSTLDLNYVVQAILISNFGDVGMLHGVLEATKNKATVPHAANKPGLASLCCTTPGLTWQDLGNKETVLVHFGGLIFQGF